MFRHSVRFIIWSFSILNFQGIHTQNLKESHLQNEIFLHPADAFTAYTLKKGEWTYNQPPFVLPLPGWAMYGITNRITMEIDLLPLVGGFFQKPHLPVPSVNFRFFLSPQNRWIPAIAFETMYQHLWNEVTQSEKPVVKRKGNSWFGHFNFSWKISRNFYTHFSAGMSYVENLYFHNGDTIQPREKFYSRSLTPDINLSLDYRIRPWISFHLTASYGTTFVYLDNIPHKRQISYGFRVAPFYRSRKAFFRNFRAEFIGFYIYLPDINAEIKSFLPVFPYFYWQWTFSNKKSRRSGND